MRSFCPAALPALAVFLLSCGAPTPHTLSDPVVLNDDGGWCWFEDPRALIADGKLVAGTVATGRFDSLRAGDVEAVVHDLASGATRRTELYDRLEADDHNSPVFLRRPDGRLLTLFARHGPDSLFYYRISAPDDWSAWGAVRSYVPSPSTRLTYSNAYLLPAEDDRVYNFFRGLDDSYKPSYVFSDDLGETWTTGHVVIDVPTEQRHRPYVRYASNGDDTVHLLYTEGHPIRFDNSLYHAFYRDGALHRSDGTPIRSLAEGLDRPEEGTRIFQGDSNHVAWSNDIELDADGRPYAAYSVNVGNAGLDYGEGGHDLRYRYARWDGERWRDFPMAYAGSRLYAGEDDYAGLAALHPHDPDVVFISTNADPATGDPLISAADSARHYEIYRGETNDGGANWTWTPVTRHSTTDNIRPVVPAWEPGRTALLWLRGTYRTYRDYDLELVAAFSQ